MNYTIKAKLRNRADIKRLAIASGVSNFDMCLYINSGKKASDEISKGIVKAGIGIGCEVHREQLAN